MKIASYETLTLLVPEDDPLANMPEEAGRKRPIVVLRLRTDSGLEGIGVTLYGGRLTRSLHAAVEDLAAATVGEDPMRIEAIIAKLRTGDAGGPGGIFTLALAAVDTALWDIRGKALGQPLWKLLGGHRDRVPTYASGALRRGLSDDQAQKAARILLDKGFREMKTQMALPGDPSPADELRRVRVVREAIGPDIKLMCDINQRWRPEQAIDIGRRVHEAGVGLFWLEDVTTFDDYAGLARVTAALPTPVAGGEYVWGIVPFRHMIEARSVDIVMVDLARVGGVTQWMKVAAHGRGLQPADRQPRHARDPGPPGRRLPARPHGRVHALDALPLRGDAEDRGRASRAAPGAGPGAHVRREGDQGVQGLTPSPCLSPGGGEELGKKRRRGRIIGRCGVQKSPSWSSPPLGGRG